MKNLTAYLYREVGRNHGAPRVWLEGAQPAKAGFAPGVRYAVTINAERKTVTLSIADTGHRIVSGKQKAGKQIPVIDLNSREALGIFEDVPVVRVIIQRGRIHILPAVAEIRRRERLQRLQEKIAMNLPISVGSISHGIGVLSKALHQGMAEKGLRSKIEFANDIREEFLNQACQHNDAWDEETRLLAAPMQELALDRWMLNHLPQCDVLEAGVPCSGASGAGRAKRGTDCAEAHPEVGHLVVPFIQLIQVGSPGTELEFAL